MKYRVVLTLVKYDVKEFEVHADSRHEAEMEASGLAFEDFEYDDYEVEEIEEEEEEEE